MGNLVNDPRLGPLVLLIRDLGYNCLAINFKLKNQWIDGIRVILSPERSVLIYEPEPDLLVLRHTVFERIEDVDLAAGKTVPAGTNFKVDLNDPESPDQIRGFLGHSWS